MIMESDPRLTPVEYAVYGVLCAAKLETGPEGARRLYRIQDRLDWGPSMEEIAEALVKLIGLGWVRQLEPVLGMLHYEVVEDGTVPGEVSPSEKNEAAPGVSSTGAVTPGI